MKAEICLFKNLASHAGSEFLTCVLPALGCVDLPLEAENELSPVCACATAVSGRADVRIPAALCALAAHVSTGITHCNLDAASCWQSSSCPFTGLPLSKASGSD